jgi:uncharacterized protein YfdQ (DUF2303 family)
MPDNIINAKSEAETVADIVRRSNTPLFNISRSGLAVFPDGRIKSLEIEAYDAFPKRKRASVKLYETYSFIEYVKAHLLVGATHIFGVATETGGSFTAILDYHSHEPDGGANWGEHVCALTLATTPEWKRWIERNSQYMTQEAFAEFIEENMLDIVRPDAGVLIDIAQLLQGKKSVNFKSGKNLKNGALTFEYSELIESTGGRANGDMEIPDRFAIGICPFVGSSGVEMEARLRFRISDTGKLTFAYILNRPFKVIEEAFNASREEIEKKTGLEIHLGTAEVKSPQIPQ